MKENESLQQSEKPVTCDDMTMEIDCTARCCKLAVLLATNDGRAPLRPFERSGGGAP